MDTLRTQWSEGRDTLGVWLSIPSIISAETAARVGFDYVCIDNQHGVNDYQTTVAMAQAVVRAGRYAPVGARSFGPVIAGMRRSNHFDWAGDGIALIPMIETVEAISNLDEILAVPGIDAIYVGPADLSITLGLRPGNNDGESKFDDALATIVKGCRNAGVVPGIHATAALVERRLEQGFRMITVTSDALAMRSSLVGDLETARGAKPGGEKSGAMY
ncbi:MAG TPA: aldolase/citrate lyase family protein [Ilumatobacteraceae bacterium]|nr:aldolase/citrate lyase family protein [Ilumatobacteraceae bacterium]